jgi:Acetyltransferase (GNAT) domain
MSLLRFEYLPRRPASWDAEVQNIAEAALFHQSSWLDFSLECNKGSEIDYFRILQGELQIGNFCALKLRRGPFTVYGDPGFGYAADQQPLIAGDVDQKQLLLALLHATRERSIDHILLRGRWLDQALLLKMGFSTSANVTHVCNLSSDDTQAWDALKGTARTRIRKAMKQGVIAETTLDPSIADHFYRFYSEVLKSKGMTPSYGNKLVHTLLSLVGGRDSLFAVWAKHQDRVIGAAFYAHDEHAMYFLDGASDPDCLHLCPNEMLHWTAIRMAVAHGISRFYIGGGPIPSRFTKKFTGYLLSQNTYHWNSNSLFPVAKGIHSVARTVTNLVRSTIM